MIKLILELYSSQSSATTLTKSHYSSYHYSRESDNNWIKETCTYIVCSLYIEI